MFNSDGELFYVVKDDIIFKLLKDLKISIIFIENIDLN